MKQAMKKILSFLPYVFFLLAVLIVLNVVTSLTKQETPQFFGYGVMHIKSGSMEPAIMTGDIILVKRTDPDELVAGDVITFEMIIEEGGVEYLTTVTHRIVAATGEGADRVFTTRGDANNAADAWTVPADAVIGRYVAKSVFFGNVYQLVTSGGPTLIYLGAIVLFLLIGLTEGVSLVKAVAEHRKTEAEAERKRMIATAKEELRQEAADTEARK